MNLKIKKYINSYNGEWKDCSLNDVYCDDFIFYLDGKEMELNELLELLLKETE